MRYEVRAWVVDGMVKCASQLCYQCPYLEHRGCQTMLLLDKQGVTDDIRELRKKIKQIDTNNLGR